MKRGNGEGSIYKNRRGRWVAALSVGHDIDTGKPKRKTKTCRTKADAINALDNLKLVYAGGLSLNADKIKLIDYISAYIDTYKRGYCRQSTLNNYSLYVTKIKYLPLCSMALTKITPSDVQAALNSIGATTMRARVLTLLRAVARQAVADRLIPADFSAGCKVGSTTTKANKIKVLSDANVAKLLDAVKNDKPLDIAVRIMLYAGLRVGECLALKWIDIDGNMLTVGQTVSGRGDCMTVAPPKNGKPRRISLPSKLLADIKKYQHWQRREIMRQRDTYCDNNIIVTYDGQICHPHIVAARLKKAGATVGVTVTPHMLRHTHATRLFIAGATPKDVQERLGHSKISMTMNIYTHYTDSRDSCISSQIDAYYI